MNTGLSYQEEQDLKHMAEVDKYEKPERTFTLDEIIEAYMSGAKECYQFAGLPSEFPEYVMGNAKEYFKSKFGIES